MYKYNFCEDGKCTSADFYRPNCAHYREGSNNCRYYCPAADGLGDCGCAEASRVAAESAAVERFDIRKQYGGWSVERRIASGVWRCVAWYKDKKSAREHVAERGGAYYDSKGKLILPKGAAA